MLHILIDLNPTCAHSSTEEFLYSQLSNFKKTPSFFSLSRHPPLLLFSSCSSPLFLKGQCCLCTTLMQFLTERPVAWCSPFTLSLLDLYIATQQKVCTQLTWEHRQYAFPSTLLCLLTWPTWKFSISFQPFCHRQICLLLFNMQHFW